MKVLVAVKRVVDYNIKVRAKNDGSGVMLTNLKMSMNPFDEIAVEAAIQLKEKGIAKEVIAITVGGDEAKDVLRNALALGADRAVLVKHQSPLEPINIAKILARIAKDEEITLAILGKQAIDDDASQTPQMLAALLGWPQASFASKLEVSATEALVTREIDGGLVTVALTLPAVVSTDLRLNQPRFATLPNIMKAKQKPLREVTAEELGIAWVRPLKTLQVFEPSPRNSKVQLLPDAATLVDKLRNEARVI